MEEEVKGDWELHCMQEIREIATKSYGVSEGRAFIKFFILRCAAYI